MKRSFRRFGILALVLAWALLPLASNEPAESSHSPAASADEHASGGAGVEKPAKPSEVTFNIQLWDQQLYYEGDPVQVKVTLTNNTAGIYRFRLADTRLFNIGFEVKDMSNTSAKPSEKYTTVLSENKPVYVREVTILPGEEMSFIETLDDYQLLPAGVFTVRAYFYPELLDNKSRPPLYSNRFNLSIRPSARKQHQVRVKIEAQVQEVMQKEKLPPDEVVAWTLSARQQNRKEAFFLYLDLESLYRGEPRRGAVYKRMSEMDRLDQLSAYREMLWKSSVDDTIATAPFSWKIYKTNYTENKATVEVIQKYNRDQFIQVTGYVYQLEKRQDVWYIVNYIVNNKGTE